MRFFKKIFIFLVVLSIAGGAIKALETDTQYANTCQSKPKVSVIIPVWNSEPWLKECLDSAKNQTLKDIQIICVDDGSTDKSGQIIDEYAKNDKRFTVIHREKGKSIAEVRNAGLALATGEYTTFLDSDDYLQLNAYEIAYKLAKKDNVDLLEFNRRRFVDGKDYNKITNNDYKDSPVRNLDMHLIYKINVVVWNKLFKSEILQTKNIRFATSMPRGCDNAFSYSFLGHAKRIKMIPQTLINHRIRKDSTYHKYYDFVIYHRALKITYDHWHSNNLIKGRERLLLELLVKWGIGYRKRFSYAKSILNSFGPDIYNPNVIKQCSPYIQKEIKKLEHAAKFKKQLV